MLTTDTLCTQLRKQADLAIQILGLTTDNPTMQQMARMYWRGVCGLFIDVAGQLGVPPNDIESYILEVDKEFELTTKLRISHAYVVGTEVRWTSPGEYEGAHGT